MNYIVLLEKNFSKGFDQPLTQDYSGFTIKEEKTSSAHFYQYISSAGDDIM